MKSFCIIGLGKFGQTLAVTLAHEGHQVMVIDTDSAKVTALADIVTNAVIGDPTNEAVLRAAGVRDYGCAVVCFTQNINENILITIMLKEIGVPKVVTRALNEGHQKVLEHIGADMIVFPEQDMAEKLAYMLAKENVTDFIEFSGYEIVEMHIPDGWVGKNLVELDLRKKYKVNVIAVSGEDGKNADVTPAADRLFKSDERVTVIGNKRDIDKLVNN